MSQRNPGDGQKGFAVGRGLLAAAETLNFSSAPQNRTMRGGENQDRGSQLPRRGGSGSHIGNTMKLFASLGLSPADLDALAQIPKEDISVETLPDILMQLKRRKGGGGMAGVPSMGMAQQRAPQPSSAADFGYGSMSSVSSSAAHSYDLDYNTRERPAYSELSRDSYGSMGMASSSESVFMQRRIGSPSQGKVQDFLGVTPTMFPHVCSLCDFDVHSNMEWNQHTSCLRHAENRRQLLQMYPDWDPGMDPGMAPARSGNLRMENTPNLAPGLLGQAPMGGGQQSGRMDSGWGGNAGNKKYRPGQVERSKVVVAKYDTKPLNNKTLFALAEPFGILRENLVLKNKAFLEMDTHEQAQDMVQYYQQNPAKMCNQPVHIYLSQDLAVIRKERRPAKPLVVLNKKKPVIGSDTSDSQVVFFSNVSREEQTELLTIAGNFGTVEKHLFLQKEAFVQLSSPEDAEILVKYYTRHLNPLIIKGRRIKLNICTKYKVLNTDQKVIDARERKNTFTSSNNSPGNRRSSSPGNRSSNRNRRSSSPGNRSSNRNRRPPSPGNRSSSKSSSKSSSRRREQKREETKSSVERGVKKREETKSSADKEEKKKEETKSGDEVSGVVEGEEEQGEEEKQECEEEKTEKDVELQNPEEAQQHPDGDPVTTATNGEVDAEAQEKEAEPDAGPSEKAENIDCRDEKSTNPEDSQMNEEELPEDMATMEDFPDNMDDFVTLDELMDEDVEANKSLSDDDYIDNTRKGGMRVVTVQGFRKGYCFLNQILKLAEPFGKVVKHLVLDLRPEAYIQFGTEEEAKAMVKFYNAGNIQAAVCDKHVKISHSQTYPTIRCGASRVVYLGQLPDIKYTDEDILKLVEPFGKVNKYFINRIKRECFVEMAKPEDAEKMACKCQISAPRLHGKRLLVYVSRKYKQLKHGHRAMDKRPTEDRDRDRDGKKRDSRSRSSAHTDEPPTKKPREEKTPAKDKKDDEGKGQEEELTSEVEMKGEEDEEVKEEESTEEQKEVNADPDSDSEQLSSDVVKPEEEEVCTIAPYDENNPVGLEMVKMGYYCRLCFLFYSNEETAKKMHCSSQTHYDKLKKHLENKKGKKTE